MRPERRPSRPGSASSTRTKSPCMAPLSSFGGIKMSPEAPLVSTYSGLFCWLSSAFLLFSTRTNPNPSRCTSRCPLTRRLRPPRIAASIPSHRPPVRAGAGAVSRVGSDHISSPERTRSPCPTSRVSCSRSSRRSRPPPRPSSRTSCLYPASPPAERPICASRSRSPRGCGVRAMVVP
jgi:hypothetical protein